MPRRFEVMADVVAVVEAAAVVARVDAGDAVSVVVLGRRLVDERVLPPVARHHREPRDEERDEEHHERRPQVDEEQDQDAAVERQLAREGPPEERTPLLPDEVPRQIEEPGEEEPEDVPREIEDAVAPVGQGRADVVLEIVLGVVHSDVVREVGLRRLAEERPEHPGHVVVHPVPATLGRGAGGSELVEHQDEGPEQIEDEEQVAGGEPPPKRPRDEQYEPRREDGDRAERDHPRTSGTSRGSWMKGVMTRSKSVGAPFGS